MASVSKKIWMVWLVVLSLILAACERPFQPSNNVPEGPDSGEVVVTPDTGGGEITPDTGETTGGGETTSGGETDSGEGDTTDSGEGTETGGEETTDSGEGDTTDSGTDTETGGEETTDSGEGDTTDSGEGTETGGEETTDSGEGDTTDSGTDTETGGETAGGETSPESGNATSGQTANPAVHVVVAGDTLYKIGLKYGISWVTLAEFNQLANPNRLTIGQEIKLPGATSEPTPSPQTEEIYVVKAGDNLYRIGLAYGISWIQIAEANGIVNPNYLIVGQQIKIPMAASGPTPQFTHVVRSGDTIFRISLQYGVAWSAIAEANDIESPYVIFPGQVLKIPGG